MVDAVASFDFAPKRSLSFVFPFAPSSTVLKVCFCLAYTSSPVACGRGGYIGKKLNGMKALGFSLKKDCLSTVTLT